ncbi:MAG: sulfatase [Verrucomicrobia bacterium]|nr:sulfatase [Verrucomicrobiota bacterium]
MPTYRTIRLPGMGFHRLKPGWITCCALLLSMGWMGHGYAVNVVVLLSDDHRSDFMGFHPAAPEWLETPAFDRMAREGTHMANAFVSTSLCSPSRASILSGRYMHHHKVVDNQRPVPSTNQFFPQYLQKAGIQTAYIGKWHMGHDLDDPRPEFDYWASFKGQGTYFNPTININGQRHSFPGYNADVLTDLAIRWITSQRQKNKPFFLQVGYKAVHYPFEPAPRHKGRYRGQPIPYPETMARTERNYLTQPRWVRERRNSIHGIDHMETGAFDSDPVPDFNQLYHQYAETVLSLDENVGRILEAISSEEDLQNTIVLYLSDNGFHLGEHGFYDKRDAFETSIRIPMLAWSPNRNLVRQGHQSKALIQNIDVAPTVMEWMGVARPDGVSWDGLSMASLVRGESPADWRDHILYEYHWEWNFPATPTLFAIRTDRYKYVYYHGTWDRDSFHDLELDPIERHNLIDIPSYQEKIRELRNQLFGELESSGGMDLPIRPPIGERLGQRKIP